MSNLSISSHQVKITDGLYCLNDLHKASGGAEKHKPKEWLSNKGTSDLIDEISKGGITPFKVTAGRYGGTFVSRELVYAYAMWISPKFHLEVIRVFDNQVKAQSELAGLLNNVREKSKSISTDIDAASASFTELKQHGQSWGAYGQAIRKAKKEVIAELGRLKDEIQMRLDLLG